MLNLSRPSVVGCLDGVIFFQRARGPGCLDGVNLLPASQRTSRRDVLHPTAIRNHTLFSHHLVKVHRVELGEAVLLRHVDLREGEVSDQRSSTDSNVSQCVKERGP